MSTTHPATMLRSAPSWRRLNFLTHHRLAGIRLTMDGRRYVMYPAEEA